MANYYGTSRTNYFRVKDEAAFTAWAKKLGLDVCPAKDGTFALFPDRESDDGSFPSCMEVEIAEEPGQSEDIDIDFMEELSKHLADGSVAILVEAGAEKLRYVHGHAQAINSKGERVSLSIDDIYEKAASLGSEITRAEY